MDFLIFRYQMDADNKNHQLYADDKQFIYHLHK